MGKTDISSDFVSSFEWEGDNTRHAAEGGVISRLPEIPDFNRLEKLTSEGTTCSTYKWEWCSRVYFVKRLKHEYLNSPQHIHAFEKEFELGCRLSHPSLPRYVDFRHSRHECYIVMEYIDGKTLKELWHKPITADRRETYWIMSQLIDVLEYLHRNNIMHYDLIPQNVMLTTELNNVVLIDLDKAFNSAYANNHGDPSRFCPDMSADASSDVDFRGLGVILSKGLWGGMEHGELRHFYDLCNKPGVTAEELREALAHQYEDVYVADQKCIEGCTCDGYKGDWRLIPVMIKRLNRALHDNKYYRDMFMEEFRIMNDCNDPTFAYYNLLRTTPDDCFIVIDMPDGISLAVMIEENHPWINESENIRHLLRKLLDSFFYLWAEGLDAMNFEVDDIFIDPKGGGIRIANFREILDTTVSDTKWRWTESEVKEVSASGKIICTNRNPLPDARRTVEFPQLYRIMKQMDERGVDMSWLSEFQGSCLYGASYMELSVMLDNSRPY